MELSKLSMKELVALYNKHNPAKPVKRFTDRHTAESRCKKYAVVEKVAEKAADKAAGKVDVTRSKAIAASWDDKRVRAARAERTKVRVAGVEYGSVLKAFRELRLPVEKHIKFRMELKATESGRLGFDGHMFSIVREKAE